MSVKAGTWPRGSHWGKKTTVVHLFSLSSFATQLAPDAGPTMSPWSESPWRGHRRCLPAECVRHVQACECLRACVSAHGRKEGEDSPVRDVPAFCVAFRTARDPILSPWGDRVPFSTLPILGPLIWRLFPVTHSPCPWWWPLMYCVPASV